MLTHRIVFLFFICFPLFLTSQNSTVRFEEWISLKQSGNPIISPDGNNIVYSVTSTDWKENTYDTEYWLIKKEGKPIQITRTAKGSSNGAKWSPDSKWIAFLADRGNKNQIHLLSVDGGEAFFITNETDGVNSFEWSPEGNELLIAKTETESKKDKEQRDRLGAFGIEGTEYKQVHLWIIPFNIDSIELAGLYPCNTDTISEKNTLPCYALPKAKRITEGDFTVNGYKWSPNGKYIAYNRSINPLINSGIYSDIALYNTETKSSSIIIKNTAGDFLQAWSPDSKKIIYTSTIDDTVTHFFKNNRLFVFDFNTSNSKEIGKLFDENKNVIDWTPQGVWLVASEKTKSNLYLLNPDSDTWSRTDLGFEIINTASFSTDGKTMAFSARKYDGLSEIGKYTLGGATNLLTEFSKQIAGWHTPINEIIRWRSKDGTEIEGVLIKPKNFQPNIKYPLLCLIHGGPTGVDRPDPIASSVYPVMQWAEKGALILRVNYRGSAGYGEKFRSLNVRNLGVGDMWDVMSGVDYLIKTGVVDTTKMGCMGWSQGGYISAFLTTNTHRFKAISVGAGISNWMTYYVNTDITPFTRQYLSGTPWSDPAIFLKTSPMTNINKASTPTLIQHGEFDRRVPIPNAYELYRGLQDRNIPSRLVVYKGFGHGINKPKERLAAIWHNWQWFNKFIWNEDTRFPGE